MADLTTSPQPSLNVIPKSSNFIQFSSDNFLLAAGGVLFRLIPTPSTTTSLSEQTVPTSTAGEKLQICILHHEKGNHWVLPKGRKDVNESIESAALRETFEETGYRCEPFPCPMHTRAPNPELYTGLRPHLEPASTEPFTVTLRTQKDGSMKIIFWYLMRVIDNSTPRIEGTQMPNEDFIPHFVDAREGIQKLTKSEYRNIAKLAVDIVENTMKATDSRPMFRS